MLLRLVRKQLAHALYQQDAATRVIARLLKERDAAQQQLQQQQQLVLQLQRSAAAAADSADADLGMCSSNSGNNNNNNSSSSSSNSSSSTSFSIIPYDSHCGFTAARGVFKVAADTNPARHAAVFGSSSSSSSGEGGGSSGESAAAAAGEEGAAAAAAAAAGVGGGEGKVISVSSGADGAIVFFNLHEQKQIAKVQAHAKACRTFLLHPTEPLVISGSDDKTVKIWRGSNDFSSSFTLGVALRRQRGDICGLALHPLNDYFAAAAADSTWSFIGIKEGRYLSVYKDLSSQYSSLAFHPDGMIMGGGGVDGNIYIWDMKGQQQRAALQGHSDRITKLTFSENGYYLATASADGTGEGEGLLSHRL
ncbi:WD-40 repeat protein, putative [Eimeria acervulina]|uniref:Pre-mRNA-processing factor 19 n=1 Tax=Eimeria acervulina TaxID=5801 RepID=U6GCF7_EIMAC|nr:WD-40 repeat protein, putative [Eimeria acervulina]CDI77825.1 WD-40 repeat protein, putative [Eimeria acervulina]